MQLPRPQHLASLLLSIFLCLVAFGCARDTTVILVRHAEKGPGQDPSLTPAGEQRAQALVEVLRREGVSAIYVTQFRHTQETAAPIAQELGLTPIIMTISGTPQAHAAAIAADIRAHHTGARVLVVGHSNTVPLVLAELGLTQPLPVIDDPTEFDRLFIATLRKDSALRLIDGTYGP